MELSRLSKIEQEYKEIHSKHSCCKQLLKNKEEELQAKIGIISNIQERLTLIEETSAHELEFLSNGIENLKECFRLEISKKEQEIILKIKATSSINSRRETELIDEIHNLQEECVKIKSHYSQILNYKEEEKNILEQDKQKLKGTIKNLEEKFEEISTSFDLNESKNYSLEYHKEFSESNKSFNGKKIKQLENNGFLHRKIDENDYYEGFISRKENEIKEIRGKFEERFRKKVQDTQEKVLVWKNKIRDDLSQLKKYFYEENIQGSSLILEKLEKTVSMII